ncbi:MAG: sugar transferase [Fibrobacterota bacterium]
MGHRLLEKLTTLIIDIIAINGALILTYLLRYESPLYSTPDKYSSLGEFYTPSLAFITTLCWVFLYFINGLYRDWFKESRLDEFLVVARTVILGIAILFLMLFSDQIIGLAKSGELHTWSSLGEILSQMKSSILMTYLLALLFSATLIRFIMHSLYAWLFRRGIAVQNIAIVGANSSSLKLIQEIENNPQLGYTFRGFIDNRVTGSYLGHPVLGPYTDIPSITQGEQLNGLIISHVGSSARDILDILNYCWDEKLTIYLAPSLMDVVAGHLKTHEIAGIPLIVLLQDHMPAWQAQVKRLFDIIISLLILVPFAPVWLLVAALVKITDPGPAVYSQERIGQNGKPFTMMKFRSMYVDAESKSGPQWATDNDPRITPFGRFMRKTRLDEIPQLINVLKGDMSFVGPRPERKYFIDKLKEEIPWYVKRLKMKPGITGWAQVKHKYDETIEDVKTKVMYDLYYFENMSLLLDLKIIIQTIIVVFTGKGAK